MASDNQTIVPVIEAPVKKIRNSSIFGHFCNNRPHCCDEDDRICAEIIGITVEQLRAGQ